MSERCSVFRGVFCAACSSGEVAENVRVSAMAINANARIAVFMLSSPLVSGHASPSFPFSWTCFQGVEGSCFIFGVRHLDSDREGNGTFSLPYLSEVFRKASGLLRNHQSGLP